MHALRRLEERLGIHVNGAIAERVLREAFARACDERTLVPHYQDGQVRVEFVIDGVRGWMVVRAAKEDHADLIIVTVLDFERLD